MKKSKKNSLLVLLLACLLVFATVLGTVAWLTTKDEKVNTFIVGNIDEPGEGPTDPVNPDPDAPDTDEPDVYDPEADGNIFEPYWKEDSILIPGNVLAKDPYVGIGEESEPAYAYVKVENDFATDVYFTLNDGWSVLDGTTATTIAKDGVTYYVDGIFKYNTILTPAEGADAWTATPLFSKVQVADTATNESLTDTTTTNITIKAFFHQAYDGEGNVLAATADEVAKGLGAWSAVTP